MAHYGVVGLWRVISELKFDVIMAIKLEKNWSKIWRNHLEKYWRTRNGEDNGECNWRT
jgi:hypothetical protein